MYTRASIAESIEWARGELHRAGITDRIRALARREFVDYADAVADEPEPPTVIAREVDAVVECWEAESRRLKAHAESKRDEWPPHVVERWLVRAEELADRVQQLRQVAA